MKKTLALFAALALLSPKAFANKEAGNGGDLCEDRIKTIRDDLAQWILNGGSQALKLPAGLSVARYNQTMLAQMNAAKITCVDETLLVGHSEKTCKNFVASDGTLMIACNVARFNAVDQSEQYVLVHHEYAGLSGFEVNVDETSNYEISNQISGYLENQVVKKLRVKPPVETSDDPFSPSVCQGPPMTKAEAITHFDPGTLVSRKEGRSKLFQRTRTCNPATGCGAWDAHEGATFVARFDDTHSHWMYAAYPFTVVDQGALGFRVVNGAILLDLPSADAGLCSSIGSPKVTCRGFRHAGNAHPAADPFSGPIFYRELGSINHGAEISFNGLVTKDCLQLRSSTQTSSDANGAYIQTETVWNGHF